MWKPRRFTALLTTILVLGLTMAGTERLPAAQTITAILTELKLPGNPTLGDVEVVPGASPGGPLVYAVTDPLDPNPPRLFEVRLGTPASVTTYDIDVLGTGPAGGLKVVGSTAWVRSLFALQRIDLVSGVRTLFRDAAFPLAPSVSGLDRDALGRIYYVNTMENLVQLTPGPGAAAVRSWHLGGGVGTSSNADVVVDPVNGHILTTQLFANTLVEFDPAANTAQFRPLGAVGVTDPEYIAIGSSGSVYVVTKSNDLVEVDRATNLVRACPIPTSFSIPGGVAADTDIVGFTETAAHKIGLATAGIDCTSATVTPTETKISPTVLTAPASTFPVTGTTTTVTPVTSMVSGVAVGNFEEYTLPSGSPPPNRIFHTTDGVTDTFVYTTVGDTVGFFAEDPVPANTPPAIQGPLAFGGLVDNLGPPPTGAVKIEFTVFDPDGDKFMVKIEVDGQVLLIETLDGSSRVDVTKAFTVGSHSGQITASDGKPGGIVTQSFTVTVDHRPPSVDCSVDVDSFFLGPPDHKLADPCLRVSVRDRVDPAPQVTSIEVFSDVNDTERAQTREHAPDAKDIDPKRPEALRLRAERLNVGEEGATNRNAKDGRVYLIIVKATNSLGKVGVASCSAVVPHATNPTAKNRVADRARAAEKFADENGGMPPPDFVSVGDSLAQGFGLEKVRPSSCGK